MSRPQISPRIFEDSCTIQPFETVLSSGLLHILQCLVKSMSSQSHNDVVLVDLLQDCAVVAAIAATVANTFAAAAGLILF